MENFRLRVFRSVARHLNFRVAAEELSLTQPAVSQQVKALESELQVTVFERLAGRVSLTPAGAVLLSYAERLAAITEEAGAAMRQMGGGEGGTLCIAASQTVGQYLLPRLLAAFLRETTGVDIQVTGGNTETVVAAVLAADVQIGMIEGPAMHTGVRVEPFARDRMRLVVAAGHPWADETIALENLSEAKLLLREQGSGTRRVVERALQVAGVRMRELQIGMTFDSTEAVLTAVEAGLGVAVVSQWAVRHQFALGTLRPVRVAGLKLTRHFSLATRTGAEPSGPAGAFRTFVLARAGDIGTAMRSQRAIRP